MGTSITLLAIAREAELLNGRDRSAADDLATLDLLISCYRRHLGGNPVGSNEEITAALLGGNSKKLAYLPQKGAFLSSHGQLVDHWGTPYFFHALAHDHLDIRSAGPDREFWTKDDLVHHPGQ
ncbi:type II secretion system protein GspG [bacterium]|nr:type II secretion system protein GspG [bacterium]